MKQTQRDQVLLKMHDDVFLNAFAMATQNLLADQGFHDLVIGKTKMSESEDFKRLLLKVTKPYGDKIQNHINSVRSAVVTIFANDGHGSGFFINKEGYALTNEHLVRDARFVVVKLISG